MIRTKQLLFLLLLYPMSSLWSQNKNHGYPINPTPFTDVHVNDSFWGQRLKASREVTIPLAFSKCETTGRYENFIRAAHPNPNYKVGGLSFDDTDVYKTIEGASYVMQVKENKKLEHYVDSVLKIVAAAQEDDGYLYTSRTMNPEHPHDWAGSERWEKVEDLSHELYNLGHMIEGAVAHYQSTGKTTFLNIAERYADCAIEAIGEAEGQKTVVPGHQIAEMALARLYVTTGKERYLKFAKFLLDKRGYTTIKQEYSQSHKPVIEQEEAVGHAVRATYMYTGMADVAALTGDSSYIKAIDRIWNNIVSKKLYITGGIGASRHGEAFGKNYELPNMSAYCETCAAIGNVYLNHRLFLLHGDAKYYDVLERTLYNGLISGVSLDGDSFFYPNPLESIGQHKRQAWFGCACCPSNISRFIPSVPGYVYAQKEKDIYINLFMSNAAEFTINNNDININQETNYPWDGKISISVNPQKKTNFTLKIRLPGWLQGKVVPSDLYYYTDKKPLNYQLKVNGKPYTPQIEKGYLSIDKTWKKGDQVELNLEMKVRTVKAHHNVKADIGKIAIERGPIVYCAEWPDNKHSILNTIMPLKPEFTIQFEDTLLKGITTINTEVQTASYNKKGKLELKDESLKLIPYYAWAHRGSGEMAVWLAQDLKACKASVPPTIASESHIEASHKTKAIQAINDQLTPHNNESAPYYHWWPRKDTTEWIIYHFENEEMVSSCSLYWFEDEPWGGCRLPQNWTLYYLDTNNIWEAISNIKTYKTEKNKNNRVQFSPIRTKALKLEVTLPHDYSAGIYEWSVE